MVLMDIARRFIGRTAELAQLHSLIENANPTIGIVYGRRRVGKSSLIRKAFEGKNVLFFEGLEARPKQEQIDNFLFQLAVQTREHRQSKGIKSWRAAFMQLNEFVAHDPHHIFLDEFQWMANYRTEIVSDLKMIWEQYLSKVPGITLVLCGSIASFMVTKVIRSSALYGRTDCQIALRAFDQFETNQMLEGKGFSERIEAQMFTGGVPRYLEILKDAPSIRLGLEKEAFTKTGYFINEFDRIFVSHFGKNPEFEKIVKYLAKWPYGRYRKQIAQALKIAEGGLLSAHLSDLESAGFIVSQTPFDRDEGSKSIKYSLNDAYLRLYFAFIKPQLKKIESELHADLFKSISQSSAFSGWMGRAFEHVCTQHAKRIVKILGFAGIDFNAGPYFSPRDEKTDGVQIDLLFDRADNVMTLCEMKYQLHPIGLEIINEIERRATVLATKFPSKTIQKVLITFSAPTADLAGSGYFYRIILAQELLDAH
jgi:hypothetical protein